MLAVKGRKSSGGQPRAEDRPGDEVISTGGSGGETNDTKNSTEGNGGETNNTSGKPLVNNSPLQFI